MSESFIKLDIETYNSLFNAKEIYKRQEKELRDIIFNRDEVIKALENKVPFLDVYQFGNSVRIYNPEEINSEIMKSFKEKNDLIESLKQDIIEIRKSWGNSQEKLKDSIIKLFGVGK